MRSSPRLSQALRKPSQAISQAITKWAALALWCLLAILIPPSAQGKVYIDITSPQSRLPIAVHDLAGPGGREISDIIREDLDFTGLFLVLDRAAFIEMPSQAYNPRNWSVIGAEAVVKGEVQGGEKVSVTIALHDVFEGREMLRKRYSADKALTRTLAHTIANDIYQAITGKPGVFRTTIAFVSERGGQPELYLSDWDGDRMRRLGISASVLLSPHWSDDASKLVYSAKRGRQWGIYVLDFNERKERLAFNAPGTNMVGDFFPGGVEFALSSSREGTPDIYVFNASSSKLRRLTSLSGIEVSPAVSPDGLTIAYVSDRGGSPQIYTTDKIGYNSARVTFEGAYNTSPAWSPKGDMLAFCGRYEGRNQVFTVRPDGSGLRVLTERGNNEEPSFSPDGRYIVFTSDRDGGKAVYIMRANGEVQRRITPPGVKAYGPRWSPK
jgi:TolB protein